MTKKFEMSMMGELTYFLGLQIKQDDKRISIFQEKYTRYLLKKYEISDSSLVKTHMVPPNNLGLDLAGFDLKGYSDSDYAGCIMDRKSTSDFGDRIKIRSHKENSEEIVDDNEKNDKDKHYDAKIDANKDDD
ncbi:retrovirus-related pol polyprotein from transposon TNT 1-94 [Tanacetum coccineum]